MKDFRGERLRALRKEKGMLQQDLAAKIGITPAMIGLYEKGRSRPSYIVLNSLCDFFHVSADYLLGRVDDENQKTSEIEGGQQ